MIIYKSGNLLEADAEALVNTVNCVGVMGKGIALQFKQTYPENFKAYQEVCRADALHPGKMFTVQNSALFNPKYIINFPTKRHWRSKSKLADIAAGLRALVQEIKELDIQSIAIPPLGCGNGGLDWEDVHPLMEESLSVLPDVQIMIYQPAGSPQLSK